MKAYALKGAMSALTLSLMAAPVVADEMDQLIINGEIEIITEAPAPDHVPNLSTVRSGWTYRSAETQAFQLDDFDNPAMIGVDIGRDLFNAEMGGSGESCASCHESPESLAGVRAVYPQWDEERGMVQTLEHQINECITERMDTDAWSYNGDDMINMSALMSYVSRGTTIDITIDGPAQAMWEQGQEMYYTRTGQLELSCANCHEDNHDNMIRADHLSQGQINGFPTYRLKNARLNSVHSRFKGCVRDTRAETYSPGSDEFVALELYLMSRANGLSVEGPAVRN